MHPPLAAFGSSGGGEGGVSVGRVAGSAASDCSCESETWFATGSKDGEASCGTGPGCERSTAVGSTATGVGFDCSDSGWAGEGTVGCAL